MLKQEEEEEEKKPRECLAHFTCLLIIN